MWSGHSSASLAIFSRELEILRRITEAGSELAPAAAMHYCATHVVEVPYWLLRSAARGYCLELNPNKPKKRGRSASPIERYRQDTIDFVRWEEVQTVRHKQREFRKEALLAQTPKGVSPRYRETAEKNLAWIGHDWLRAYECASMMLQKVPAFGGPDAMKKSYCRVEANIKLPSKSWRYFLFDPEFLLSIGVAPPCRWKWSIKVQPFYNLTL